MSIMRTTVTLDPRSERLIRRAMERGGQSFKTVLNEAIQRGLEAGETEEPFTVQPRPMGLRTGIDPGRLNSLADKLETEAFVEQSSRT
ncbi:antitoxin [Microlunatus elymi]|uniref:Antitoxin n=1 Tax=Microlunatus elymi TaxID=2596828 RepID=A0A516Q1P8_9ACTN|nr:antitoxin [Microlunatus elymi]QDP97328.1 antitoxin [Microlunatus elymi]